MPAFILLSGGILAFAVTYELLALQYHPAALVALFWSLPVSQQISWIVIGLAPIALMLFALVQHCMLAAKRKAAEALDARLRGIRLDVLKGEQGAVSACRRGGGRHNRYGLRCQPAKLRRRVSYHRSGCIAI